MERGPTVPIGTVLIGLNVLLREGLARILSAADFHILASASGVDDPVLSSLPQEQPILLIIDVSDDFDAAMLHWHKSCPSSIGIRRGESLCWLTSIS
jgi:hypothetical protein